MTWVEDLAGVKNVRFDGEAVATRAKINFLGDGVTVADNAGSGQTDVTVLSGGTAVYVTDLTALAGTVDRARVYCDGYYARYDGGGGTFVWHAGDSTTANGGTVLGAGTGRWKRVFSGAVNVRWFGAKGNGSTDDTAAIQAALSCLANGECAYVPRGTSVTSSTVEMTTPVNLVGDGTIHTALNPSGATDNDDTLSVTPSLVLDHTLQKVEGVALHNPNNGQRKGRHGVYLDTTVAGAYLPKFTMRECAFGTPSNAAGFGVYHENDSGANVNGGLYCSTIENNVVKGGIKLESTGDSNNILRNLISGQPIGVHVNCTAGASCTDVSNNNITSSDGAIRIDGGHRFRVVQNNTENYLAAGALANNNGAGININGNATADLIGGVVDGNLVACYADTDATSCIRIARSRGTLIQNNTLLSGGGPGDPTVGILVESTCTDVRIGPNQFNAAITTQVTDNGVGTMGVVKDGRASLQNGWVQLAADHHAFTYYKSVDGIVHVLGAIKGGTTTNGTQIFTMPVGFRPSQVVRAPITNFNSGTGLFIACEMTVETAGEVRITQVTDNTIGINFNFSFPAANLAHAVSHE